MKEVLKRFDHGVTYTETEVNSILLNVFSSGDYVEQRRYLITFGFFKRSSDGRAYQMMELKIRSFNLYSLKSSSMRYWFYTAYLNFLSSVSIIQSQERYSKYG